MAANIVRRMALQGKQTLMELPQAARATRAIPRARAIPEVTSQTLARTVGATIPPSRAALREAAANMRSERVLFNQTPRGVTANEAAKKIMAMMASLTTALCVAELAEVAVNSRRLKEIVVPGNPGKQFSDTPHEGEVCCVGRRYTNPEDETSMDAPTLPTGFSMPSIMPTTFGNDSAFKTLQVSHPAVVNPSTGNSTVIPSEQISQAPPLEFLKDDERYVMRVVRRQAFADEFQKLGVDHGFEHISLSFTKLKEGEPVGEGESIVTGRVAKLGVKEGDKYCQATTITLLGSNCVSASTVAVTTILHAQVRQMDPDDAHAVQNIRNGQDVLHSLSERDWGIGIMTETKIMSVVTDWQRKYGETIGEPMVQEKESFNDYQAL